jgi:hypothetical protein
VFTMVRHAFVSHGQNMIPSTLFGYPSYLCVTLCPHYFLSDHVSKEEGGRPRGVPSDKELLSGSTRVYPEVAGLAAWSENCKWYSSLPLVAVVSPFFESV